jgi:hypothetical protein
MSVMSTSPEQFMDLIRDTVEAYGRVVRSTGVRLD